MVNSGKLCEVTFETPGGQVNYDGDTEIDGVPGTAAPVICDYLDVAGSLCGALLPTGNVLDEIDGIKLTCIDNGMPVVIVRAEDFGITGYEEAEDLDSNERLKSQLESLRMRAGQLMKLGDVSDKTVPKMCLTAPARDGGLIATRTFIPHVCHRSIGVLGAISVASACMLPGSTCHDHAVIPVGSEKSVAVEHPAGALVLRIVVDDSASASNVIERAGVIRTARLIMTGNVMVPSSLWRGPQLPDQGQGVASQ
jgi:4-oxalomesaconate tautomerase